MKVTVLILLNVLERNIHKLLFPGFDQKIIMLVYYTVYNNKNINDRVDYEFISFLIIQKKGMTVLYKRDTSFKPNIIMFDTDFFISIFWFINWSIHHIDCSFCL